MEADLVAHSGPTAEGSFVQTLTMTDIATGWTECAPLLVREQTVLVAALSEIRKRMPFPLLGFDTDNFINETVHIKDAGVKITRCRPYCKTIEPGCLGGAEERGRCSPHLWISFSRLSSWPVRLWKSGLGSIEADHANAHRRRLLCCRF
jgi:hypothetical protein